MLRVRARPSSGDSEQGIDTAGEVSKRNYSRQNNSAYS